MGEALRIDQEWTTECSAQILSTTPSWSRSCVPNTHPHRTSMLCVLVHSHKRRSRSIAASALPCDHKVSVHSQPTATWGYVFTTSFKACRSSFDLESSTMSVSSDA